MRHRRKGYLLFGTLIAGLFCAAARPAVAPRVAFFGFQMINTSPAPTTPVEDRRIQMLDALFRVRLDHSGRFKIVKLPSGLRARLTESAAIGGCNGCERGLARDAGADWAAWGTVQKVSNLILNINVYMEDADSGKMEFVKSVDIRGNTDQSWRRGLDYLLQNYLFIGN